LLCRKKAIYQTRVWTVLFFTHSVVVWCAAVVKQSQAPRASVSKPTCAVDMQVVFPFESSLIHAVVQHILLSWPDPGQTRSSKPECTAKSVPDKKSRFISLARPILVEGQISLCIVVCFFAKLAYSE
jgi:hypothetical protein